MNNSPFELFRRNLKPLMVFLTALALFAFVVLPVLDSYMRQNAGVSGEDVVASYAGTKLSRSRVDYFTRNHQSTVRFLLELAEETMARGGREVGFEINPQTNQVSSIGINQNPGFETSMRTMMLSAQAAKDGFELDDNSLQVWLERYTDGMVSNSDINAMLMQSTQNQMGRPHLYEQLRSHLLASLYINRGYAGLYMGDNPMAGPLMTPQEQWANFLKLNRNAVVNAYGVLVNDHLDKTNPTPSDAEVAATYEEGKDRDPNDQSTEPAFHRRYSAKFEYLVGDSKKFLDEEVAKLSEEEIRGEYERLLKGGEFQLPETPQPPEGETPESPEGETPESPEGETPESPAGATEPSESNASETPADSETPAEPARGEDQPATDADAPADRDADAPAEGTAEPSQEGAGEADSDPESAQGEEPSQDQSNATLEPAVRLVALQEETETPAEQVTTDDAAEPDAQEADPEQGEDPEQADPEQADPEQADPKQGEDPEPASDPPADEPEPAESETPDPPADETPTAETADGEPKVEAFEDVRQSIAENMAGPAARARLEAAITNVAAQMRLYGNKLAIHESNVSIGQGGQPPVKPDLKAIASELGLQYEIIGPYTEVSITDEPIANSSEIGTQFGGRGPSFTVMMYGFDNGQTQLPRQQLFAPVRTADAPAGKQYVSWKIVETEAYTPTLAEVRDEVVMVIRLKEARQLAREASEAIAKQASSQAEKPLEEIVPEGKRENVKTGLGPFSWMDSFGFAGATIGNVPELDSVGDEFMQTVFQSEVGEYGVAMNQSGRVVYVVKPTKFEPSLDELREQFKQPTNRIMAMLLGNDAGPILSDFYDSIDENAGFVSYVDRDQE